MKKIYLFLLIAATGMLCTVSCRKQETSVSNENLILEKNTDFRNYVATDLLSRMRCSFALVKQMKKEDIANFKSELMAGSESGVMQVFNNHGQDYGFFQKTVVARVIRRARMIQILSPSLRKYSDAQIDILFDQAYHTVADDILESANSRVLADLQNRKTVSAFPKNVNTSQGQQKENIDKSINSVDNSVEDYYLLNEFSDFIPEDLASGDIVTELDKANSDGLTAAEAWNCFKGAMGFAGLGMGGIVGWARATAGLQIQELVLLASKWALKHIGWIGAAIAVADFSSCIYDSI